ncbi:RluA family pseudouridine synthase [Paenibacillus radicis (ex Gao et al. 2016)]|uniref:RNA pseudouridylate synthase n=1 Tax=Paenibacillus radicis (ex Gao et al. 2016) TaxID=1737354 RepID=A0A917LW13_9BACL|nr:RNA pseudouridine synthase [Paenibacillus radicis (ex Gao et al. 2016)]GGG58764.1 RNA pseudouridine synthase [Paenibacillus radicis (ex Gao et al. 2016)]
MAASKAPLPSIEVLYEDNHMIAVVKPPGIPSQEDESGDPDMLTLIKEDLKERHNKPGNVFLGLVHRLDRQVGGVMVFAKTSKGASRLSESVRNRSFGKTYMCVVHGVPAAAEAQLRHYIRKDAKRNQVTVFDAPAAEAKEAILDYAVVASQGSRSLVAIRLHTGRPHQIRAQMAHIGCPLVADRKYGAPATSGVSDPALWSTSISVPHPVSKESTLFRSLPYGSAAWTWWTPSQLEQAANWFIKEG